VLAADEGRCPLAEAPPSLGPLGQPQERAHDVAFLVGRIGAHDHILWNVGEVL
jgi:hypothetical protein